MISPFVRCLLSRSPDVLLTIQGKRGLGKRGRIYFRASNPPALVKYANAAHGQSAGGDSSSILGNLVHSALPTPSTRKKINIAMVMRAGGLRQGDFRDNRLSGSPVPVFPSRSFRQPGRLFDETAVDVFVQDAGDQCLIGNTFFQGAGLDVEHVR